jgi:hypothetical protein
MPQLRDRPPAPRPPRAAAARPNAPGAPLPPSELRHDDLLLHYVRGAQGTLQSIDQLGNFLMGFGVLALGYLLQADLSAATAVLGAAGGGRELLAIASLGAWATAVGLLVAFVLTYVFRVIAGRSVHGVNGKEDGIGAVIDLPEDLSMEGFMASQRSFPQFLRGSYRPEDQRDPAALLYARWSYLRYMGLCKLVAMQRMRGLLGLALVFAVGFKLLVVYQEALPPS